MMFWFPCKSGQQFPLALCELGRFIVYVSHAVTEAHVDFGLFSLVCLFRVLGVTMSHLYSPRCFWREI